MKSACVLLSILLASVLHAHSSLVIIEPLEERDSFISVLYKFIGRRDEFNITAEVTKANPFQACSSLKNAESLQGKLVLVEDGLKRIIQSTHAI